MPSKQGEMAVQPASSAHHRGEAVGANTDLFNLGMGDAQRLASRQPHVPAQHANDRRGEPRRSKLLMDFC
jgi:hypothetical protein